MTVYIFAGTVQQAGQYGRRALTTEEYARSSIIARVTDLRGRRWAAGDQLHYVGTYLKHQDFLDVENEIQTMSAVSGVVPKIVYEDRMAETTLDPVPDVEDLAAIERWLA